MWILHYIGIILLFLGAVVCLIAAVGIIKFKSFFNKAHPAGLNDVFGCGLILIGLIFLSGLSAFSLKLLLLIVIILITSPTSTYILTRIAARTGNKDE